MARQPKKNPTQGTTDSAEGNVLQGAVVAAQQVSENAHEIAVQIGYDGPITVVALEDGIRFYQRRSVEAMMELGKRLLLLKEITPHGEFVERTAALGVEYTLASRIMTAAIKFSKVASTQLLGAAGNQTKLLELLVLDDEEIQALEDGGSARGVTLDDIDTMSVRELRKALREAKDEAGANQELLRVKNAKLDALQKSQRRIAEVAPDQVIAELRTEATSYFNDVIGGIRGQLGQTVGAIQEYHAEQGGDSTAFISGLLAQLRQATQELAERYDIPEVSIGGAPEWTQA
jgi:hypothetical protein